MNSNYQLNEFYVKERIASHVKAAETQRRAQLAGRNGTLQTVAKRVYQWPERFIKYVAARKIGTGNVSAPTLDLNQS